MDHQENPFRSVAAVPEKATHAEETMHIGCFGAAGGRKEERGE